MLDLRIENALTEIGKIALQGVPDKCGYLFNASRVREVLNDLVTAYAEEYEDQLGECRELLDNE